CSDEKINKCLPPKLACCMNRHRAVVRGPAKHAAKPACVYNRRPDFVGNAASLVKKPGNWIFSSVSLLDFDRSGTDLMWYATCTAPTFSRCLHRVHYELAFA